MPPLCSRLKYVLSVAVLAFAALRSASAQASPTAIRGNSIDLFAAGTYTATDYGKNDSGFTIGGDFTHHLRLFDAALDVRYSKGTGDAVGEKTFAGGLKASRLVAQRFRPYANFLVGYGVITFNNPVRNFDGTYYSYDNSTVYDIGGGVDIDLTRSFALKVDGQYQYWNLGSRGPNDPGIKLNPALVSVGVIYHLPYRFLRPRRY